MSIITEPARRRSPRNTGRRPHFEASYHARRLFDAPLLAVTNKDLLKAARDAGTALALDRSEYQTIKQLALCFGGQQLAAGLLCWPSNATLCAETKMSERTLRRAISSLCARGLIVMRNSANGKRFPIKNYKGEIVDARGFDLTPLYARSAEFAERAKALEMDAQLRRRLRDDLSAARNTVMDLCFADATGALAPIRALADAVTRPGHDAPAEALAEAIDAYHELAAQAEAILYQPPECSDISGYAGHKGRHSEQNSNSSIEDCKIKRSGANAPQLSNLRRADGAPTAAFRKKERGGVRQNEQDRAAAESGIPKDIALWRAACPDLEDYGELRRIEDVASIGAQLLRGCGLAQHGLDAAIARLGALNAGLLAAFVVQRHADGERPGGTPIRKPGGLFVRLMREIVNGRENLETTLTAMQRRRRIGRYH